MITIAKASAGSGKTYTLAKTYIELLLSSNEPRPYRHILAVTFTNKATEEMKSRIVKELDILANAPKDSSYFKDFVPSLCPDEQTLRARCSALLSEILNDYSAFSVCTIDKFFQSVLRSFARELGQFDSYQVEIDKKSVVQESVDRLLDNLKATDRDMVGWLKESMMSQISNKGYFSLEDTLYTAALDLQSPEFKAYLSKNGISDLSKTYSKTSMRALRKACDDVISDFTKKLSTVAQKILGILSLSGIGPSDAKKGIFSGLQTYASLNASTAASAPAVTLSAALLDREKLFSKANVALAKNISAGYEITASELLSLFGGDLFIAYNTAFQIRESIYGLGISKELSEAFTALLKDKNILCLDDSSSLLTRIIDGSDVPFVYEKTGVRYHHFLLDEFQDTSLVQWENFRPLLKESDDSGRANLVVGDVKQSIYRWRQSDWNLLNSQVKTEFPSSKEYLNKEGKPALGTNFRTEENIVNFNNSFFEGLRDSLAASFGGEGGKMISGIYSDVRQAPSKTGGLGQVKICFAALKKKDETVPDGYDPVLERTVREVVYLHDEKGVKYGDIAVVCRKNSPGEMIANALMDKGIPVISDDSLTVSNSIVVRRLVSILSFVENPENEIAGYLAREIMDFTPSEESSLVSLAESVIQGMRQKDEHLVESHSVYIQAFMDWMQSWVERNGNHLADFLRAWADTASNPVKIASPSSSEAVRIITIHKAKGLEFPYVIIPGLEDIKFFKSSSQWAEISLPSEKDASASEGVSSEASESPESPEFSEVLEAEPCERENGESKPSEDSLVDKFKAAVDGQIFKPTISSKSAGTYFNGVYEKEKLYQCIDALNLMYVALTRPELGLCLICGSTSSSKDISTAADALNLFVASCAGSAASDSSLETSAPASDSVNPVRFASSQSDWGTEYTFGAFCSHEDVENARKGGKKERYARKFIDEPIPSTYPTYPMDSSRLRVDSDAADFFSEDGAVGVDASTRLRGIVLHNILSSISTPEDLPEAIERAVDEGSLSASQSEEALAFLSTRIEKVSEERGWFLSEKSKVLNERPIALSSGEQRRPDRVEISSDGTSAVIIDYKFGHYHKSGRITEQYHAQVLEYIAAYRQMGFAKVEGYLWYVGAGVVEKVDE